jgi:hypothetical protein
MDETSETFNMIRCFNEDILHLGKYVNQYMYCYRAELSVHGEV